jgi:para-nitrobenzyl esterase
MTSSSVTLSNGTRLDGYEAKSNRVRIFRSIPYATCSRFKRSTAAPTLEQPLDCTRDRGIAIQPNLNMQMLFFSAAQKAQFVAKQFVFGFGWNADPRRPQPLAAASAFAAAPQSENCLFLTVHAPPRAVVTNGGLRPVMLFVHGGAFVQGAGTCDLWAPTSGSRLVANENVVAVFVNYRLGAFGFLPVDGGDSNCGLSDVLESLRWVQREISAFGGDPANVTVFGESAGAMIIGSLLVSPHAKGLFHRAILQSGVGACVLTREQGDRLNTEFASVLGLQRCAVDSLAAFDGAALLAGQNALLKQKSRIVGLMAFQPLVDGDILPGHPLELTRQGKTNAGVDVIIGWTRDEYSFFAKVRPQRPAKDLALVRFRLETCFGASNLLVNGDESEQSHKDGANQVLTALLADQRARKGAPPAANADELLCEVEALDIVALDRLMDDFSSWSAFGAPGLVAAQHMSRNGHKVYVYQFDCESAFFGGAAHALELPFVFGTTDVFPPRFHSLEPSKAAALSYVMMRAWANFARSGDPNVNPTPSTAPRVVPQLPETGWLDWASRLTSPLFLPSTPSGNPDVMPIDTFWPGESTVTIAGWERFDDTHKAVFHFDSSAPLFRCARNELPAALVLLAKWREHSLFSWGGPPTPKALKAW